MVEIFDDFSFDVVEYAFAIPSNLTANAVTQEIFQSTTELKVQVAFDKNRTENYHNFSTAYHLLEWETHSNVYTE